MRARFGELPRVERGEAGAVFGVAVGSQMCVEVGEQLECRT